MAIMNAKNFAKALFQRQSVYANTQEGAVYVDSSADLSRVIQCINDIGLENIGFESVHWRDWTFRQSVELRAFLFFVGATARVLLDADGNVQLDVPRDELEYAAGEYLRRKPQEKVFVHVDGQKGEFAPGRTGLVSQFTTPQNCWRKAPWRGGQEIDIQPRDRLLEKWDRRFGKGFSTDRLSVDNDTLYFEPVHRGSDTVMRTVVNDLNDELYAGHGFGSARVRSLDGSPAFWRNNWPKGTDRVEAVLNDWLEKKETARGRLLEKWNGRVRAEGHILVFEPVNKGSRAVMEDVVDDLESDTFKGHGFSTACIHTGEYVCSFWSPGRKNTEGALERWLSAQKPLSWEFQNRKMSVGGQEIDIQPIDDQFVAGVPVFSTKGLAASAHASKVEPTTTTQENTMKKETLVEKAKRAGKAAAANRSFNLLLDIAQRHCLEQENEHVRGFGELLANPITRELLKGALAAGGDFASEKFADQIPGAHIIAAICDAQLDATMYEGADMAIGFGLGMGQEIIGPIAAEFMEKVPKSTVMMFEEPDDVADLKDAVNEKTKAKAKKETK